jgi:hypothetical protein
MSRLSLPSMSSEFPESNDAPVTRHYWESRSGSVTPSPSFEWDVYQNADRLWAGRIS